MLTPPSTYEFTEGQRTLESSRNLGTLSMALFVYNTLRSWLQCLYDLLTAGTRGVEGWTDGIFTDALKSWHQKYAAIDGNLIQPHSAVVRAVESDMLDYEWIECQVQHLLPKADVVDGFCSKCRHLLDHWPKLAGPSSGECTVAKRFHSYEVEAAARQGCRFCLFVLSRLEHDSLLDTFRRIEARLRKIGDDGTASLSIQEHWGHAHTEQFLWPNFPGKTANHVNDVAARAPAFGSHVLLPPGEPA